MYIRCATKFPLFVNRCLQQYVLSILTHPLTSWSKLRRMVNKPFWHISDFVLASDTFGCVEMSDFVPNNRHLREVSIFFFHSQKAAAESHCELQKVYGDAALSETTCRDWFRRFKDGDFDVDDRPCKGRLKTCENWPCAILTPFNKTRLRTSGYAMKYYILK